MIPTFQFLLNTIRLATQTCFSYAADFFKMTKQLTRMKGHDFFESTFFSGIVPEDTICIM